MEVDSSAIDERKEGGSAALLQVDEQTDGSPSDFPPAASWSDADIEMMFRFVQAATRANQCSCVMRILLCRCPVWERQGAHTAVEAKAPALRSLRHSA